MISVSVMTKGKVKGTGSAFLRRRTEPLAISTFNFSFIMFLALGMFTTEGEKNSNSIYIVPFAKLQGR